MPSAEKARPARLLFVGDIHLGRRPGRLPPDLGSFGVDPAELTPAAAWSRTVEHACGLAAPAGGPGEGPGPARAPGAPGAPGLDAVVLAGDVVESLQDRFEALAHLDRGVRRLAAAGIPVFAVAGNHDVEALPRLAGRVEGFRLLGRGGRWERAALATPAGRVDLLGWSFPDEKFRDSPLEAPGLAAEPGVPTLGVLHCDLGASRSDYAPVSRQAFERAPGDAWLLGHIHAPGDLSGRRPVGYLGSLVGLDPGEPGAHGPWVVEVAGPGAVSARQVPLAPLRWETATATVDEQAARDEDALHDAVRAALGEARRRARADGGRALAVGCRVRLEGRLQRRAAVRALCQRRPDEWPREERDGAVWFVEKLVDATRPAVDLESLARGADPPALLARRLLAIERGDADATPLLQEAATRLRRRAGDPHFEPLGRAADDEERWREEARQRLLRTGLRSLEAMLEAGRPA